MKIKLTNYPYDKYTIGDICDFGEEKNASLVSFQRAVWVEEKFKKTESKVVEEIVKETPPIEEEKQAELETKEITQEIPEPEEEKKFLQNELKEQIEQKKSKTSKSSFWDKLK